MSQRSFPKAVVGHRAQHQRERMAALREMRITTTFGTGSGFQSALAEKQTRRKRRVDRMHWRSNAASAVVQLPKCPILPRTTEGEKRGDIIYRSGSRLRAKSAMISLLMLRNSQ